jgi:BMFP domain-containing protein YqiC
MGIETEQRLALLEQRLAALEAAVKARWVEPLAAPAETAPAPKPAGKPASKTSTKRRKA